MFNPTHLHPLSIHFPIALILVGCLSDFVYLFIKKEIVFQKMGFYLMIIGTLAAIVAFTTGHLFANAPTQGEVFNVFLRHKGSALMTLIVMSVASIFRLYLIRAKKEETSLKWIVFGLSLIGSILVAFTGFLGGKMVYDFMLGI